MKAEKRAQEYGLSLLEYHCMEVLDTRNFKSATTILKELKTGKIQGTFYKIKNEELNYDAICVALGLLLLFGFVHCEQHVQDYLWQLTEGGEQLLRTFNSKENEQ